MGRRFHDQRVFWRQFREHFHSTGSVLPSSRFLGRALARYVGTSQAPARVLEVGPGTGAVTTQVVRRLGAEDQFDLVELNDAFVRRLNQRFETEDEFRQVAPRSHVLHKPVEELAGGEPYDVIISGLPLNNFSVADVTRISDVLLALLHPGGTLSFFEYIAIRRARALVSGRQERARLHGIDRVLGGVLKAHEIRRDFVWRNVPPACVHHVRMPPATND